MEVKPYFELNFRPNFALVTVVRRFVNEFNRRFLTAGDSARIALATHELLENAVKFSADGSTTIRMEITDCSQREKTVRILLRNRATPAHIEAVRKLLTSVERAPTAEDFYQQLLIQRAKIKDGTGGLGLARICAEGDMVLTCAVEGDVIAIQAATAIEEGAAACLKC